MSTITPDSEPFVGARVHAVLGNQHNKLCVAADIVGFRDMPAVQEVPTEAGGVKRVQVVVRVEVLTLHMHDGDRYGFLATRSETDHHPETWHCCHKPETPKPKLAIATEMPR